MRCTPTCLAVQEGHEKVIDGLEEAFFCSRGLGFCRSIWCVQIPGGGDIRSYSYTVVLIVVLARFCCWCC